MDSMQFSYQRLCHTTGLVGIWSKRSEVPTDKWIECLRQSADDVKFLCYDMSFLLGHPEFKEEIKWKLSEGARVKILFGSPSGEMSTQEREQMKVFVAELKAISDAIEVRYCDVPVHASVYDFGEDLFVLPYLYVVEESDAPLLWFDKEGGEVACVYDEYFESVWEDSRVR